LKSHNDGQSPHTSKFKSWKLVTYVAFSDESKAIDFEKYLKSGSGRAFAEKRLWGTDVVLKSDSKLVYFDIE